MIVRVARGTIVRGRESSIFETVRTVGESTPNVDGLVRMTIARRAEGGRSELVAISMWRDAGALAG